MPTNLPMLFESLWRNKWLTSEATSIQEMSFMLREAANDLDVMASEGVVLDLEGSDMSGDYARLITEASDVAGRFGFEPVEIEDEEDGGPDLDEESNEGGMEDEYSSEDVPIDL